jgi:hypothetical protein
LPGVFALTLATIGGAGGGGGEKPSAAPAAKATKIAIFVLSVAVIVMWARLMHEDQRA